MVVEAAIVEEDVVFLRLSARAHGHGGGGRRKLTSRSRWRRSVTMDAASGVWRIPRRPVFSGVTRTLYGVAIVAIARWYTIGFLTVCVCKMVDTRGTMTRNICFPLLYNIRIVYSACSCWELVCKYSAPACTRLPLYMTALSSQSGADKFELLNLLPAVVPAPGARVAIRLESTFPGGGGAD